ncbi:MAG: MFS transporter [Proteobacteria bacterium]|nr:MFS transporter [Pseudomonadota bacterium]
MDGFGARQDSIETRTSWVVAIFVVALLTLTYGAQLIVVVALKPISETLDVPRAIPSLAAALVWFGTGSGGIAMGLFADRVGVRWTVSIGTLMTGVGLLLSASGSGWALLVGHGLFMGLLGGAGIVPPLIVYVSRWFDRRRGTALALISSGNYIAGFLWPWLFQLSVARIGWQQTMVAFAALVTVLGVPAAFLCLRLQPPTAGAAAAAAAGPAPGTRVLGLRPNAAMAVLALAPFFCCVPMAMPTAHLVAMCSDIGLSSGTGALMLSMLLGIAFITRQFWGWVADRLGGLGTVLLGSAAQAVAILIYAEFPSTAGVVTGSVVYGLGFAGIVPAYVLAIRDLYPSREAGWRVPIMLLSGMTGMAVGSWLAGAIFDATGHYGLAFQVAFVFNVVNIVIVGLLVLRHGGLRVRPAYG